MTQAPTTPEQEAALQVMTQAKAVFNRAREDGRRSVDEAWAPSISAIEQRLELVRDALNGPELAPEVSEVLTRQLTVLAESLGRCRASRIAGYAQTDATAMAQLRAAVPPQAGPSPLMERIGAAARGLGREPVIPRPVAVPPEERP